MAGESDHGQRAGSASTPKGYKIKNVRWDDDGGQKKPAQVRVTNTDGSTASPSTCKCNAEHKSNEKTPEAQKKPAKSINPNEPLEKEDFEGVHNLQPLVPGWYLHRSANPMASLGRSPFTTWAPVQPGGVTVIGQAPAAPVYIQQQPAPVYMGMGAPPMGPMGPVPYMGHINHPQIVRAPGHPGGGPPMVVRPGMYPGAPAPGISGVYAGGNIGPTFYGPPGGAPLGPPGPPGIGLPPDITGIGRTAAEIAAEQAHIAEQQDLTKPQDFKPADDDPSRFYWMRELDGEWTQRNRMTIDHLGCRWYLHEGGYFYAVRLPT